MADNVTLNPGAAGDVMAADDVSGVKYQVIKLALGADGAAALVANANPIPISDAGGSLTVDGTVSVTGVATAANQTSELALLTTIDADTGNIATNTSTTATQTTSAATSLAVLDDWDESDRAKVNPIVGQAGVAAGAGAVGATVQRMTLASDDPAVALLGTIDTDTSAMVTALQLLDNAVSGNEFQVDVVGALPAGTNNIGDVDVLSIVPGTAATSLGKAEDAAHTTADTGVLMLGVRRDTAAVGSDTDGDYSTLNVDANGRLHVNGSGVTQPVSGTVTANLGTLNGAATSANQDTANTALAAIQTAVQTLDNAISGSEIQADIVAALPAGANLIGSVTAAGAAAHGAAVSGNPVLMGLEARTTNPTAVDSGDVVRPYADKLGKQVVLMGALHELDVDGNSNMTDTNADDILAAGGSGTRIRVTWAVITNRHATQDATVTLRDGTTAKLPVFCKADGHGVSISNPKGLFTCSDNAAATAISSASADILVAMGGYYITT